MAALLPGKFLYLGTPRAASTATHDALKAIPGVKIFNQHITRAAMIEEGMGPYQGEFTFAAVRNPYDLVVSWWLRSRPLKTDTFLDFLRHHQNKHFEIDGRLFWMCVEDVEVMHYETLQEDLNRIVTGLGLDPVTMRLMNVTPRKKRWRKYYGPEEIEALNDRFGHEIDRYGYDRL